MENSKIGQIVWHDLTVDNAEEVSAFYEKVVGWKKQPLSMGTYNDFVMADPDTGKEGISGVCHARGANSNIPPQWLIYVKVANLDASIDACQKNGGKILGDKRKMGDNYYSLIQDPAGAYMMLFE